MSKWADMRIDELGEVITGSTPSTRNEKYWNGDFPFYSPADFSESVYCDHTEKYVTADAMDCSRPIPENAVMFTCISSIGKTAVSRFQGITNQQINTVIANKSNYCLFIYYLLKHNAGSFIQYAPRTTIPIINKNDFSKFSFLVPTSLSEQRKIAHILYTVDEVIQCTESAIAKYKNIKQGMMQDFFTRGIDLKTGKLRPKYEDAPELYDKTELGWVPKEWDVVKLEDIAVQIGDGIHTTPKYVNNSEYFFINGNNLHNGNIVVTGKTECVSAEEYKKHYIELGECSILISINGTIGNIAFYNGEKVILGKSAAYINCRTKTDRSFIYYLLQSYPICRYFENQLTGSTIKNLSLLSIRNTPVLLPEPNEQMEITNRLKCSDSIIESETNSLIKQQNLKQGLMSALLTGSVPVKVDEERRN